MGVPSGTDGSCVEAPGKPTGLYSAPGSLHAPRGSMPVAMTGTGCSKGGGKGGGNWLEKLFVFDPGALEQMRSEVANEWSWR